MPTNGNGRKKRRRLIFGGIALGLVALVFTVAAATRPDARLDPSKLAPVERGDVARSVVATGKIWPLSKVEVKSKASGIVEKIFVDYGEPVKAGQVLVELDKEELQAQVREARANLMAAEAAFERNQVEALAPDLPFYRSATERARKLYEDGLVSTSVLDDAEKAYQLAVNKQRAARSNAAVTRAEVAKARAMLERADQNLKNSTIVSPMDGIVLSRNVEVGDAVSSILVLGSQATLIATLGDVTSVYVLGKVDEADIGRVFLGQPARIVVEAFKDKKFEGEVTKISPMGEEKDNVTTFEVRVSIDNPDGALKANMTANAEIILEEHQGVLLVPESAVIYDKERRTFLEVPDADGEGGKRRIAANLGISNGIKTELLGGLKEGDTVVLQ
jgi:HlyD family secretion protein